jgi:hypothetical protein
MLLFFSQCAITLLFMLFPLCCYLSKELALPPSIPFCKLGAIGSW